MELLSKIKLSETLLVGSIPVIGYLAAYFYQLGKYSFFNIPLIFVQVNVEVAILATILTSLILTIPLTFLYFGTKDNRKPKQINRENFWETLLILIILLSIVCIFLVFLNTTVLTKMLIWLLVILIIVIVVFLPPLVKFPEIPGYINKFNTYSISLQEAELKRIEESRKSSLLPKIARMPQLNYILSISFIAIWIFLSFLIGYASNQYIQTFITYNNEGKTYISIATFNNSLLLVGVDREKKLTNNQIVLIPLDHPITLNQESIGILNKTDQ